MATNSKGLVDVVRDRKSDRELEAAGWLLRGGKATLPDNSRGSADRRDR
jgi:hypothetical protein